jgi:hypothetical protein
VVGWGGGRGKLTCQRSNSLTWHYGPGLEVQTRDEEMARPVQQLALEGILGTPLLCPRAGAAVLPGRGRGTGRGAPRHRAQMLAPPSTESVQIS